MSTRETAPPALDIPKERRAAWGPWILATGLVAVTGLAAWGSGIRPSQLWSTPKSTLATVSIDEGTITLIVTENGSLESADSATVRCQVEALMGTTAAQGGAGGARGGAATGQQGQTGAPGGAGGAAGTQQAGAAATPTAAATSSAAAKTKGQTGGAAKAGGAKAKATGAGVASKTPAAGGGAAAGGAGGGASGADASAQSSGIKQPDIQSFNYIVEPHIPLRGAKAVTATPAKQAAPPPQQGGSRGGSRGSRGGPGSPQTEMPGSTRIIAILAEGSRVKAGDVVCELDSAAFKDEVQAQRIRFVQAKSWVEQAKSILEVNEIALREYNEGIFPKDVQLVKDYIAMCQIEEGRARRNLDWSATTVKKGFRSQAQLKADMLAYDQAKFALTQAEGMQQRLIKFTEPRIRKARLAKIEAIKSDLASQEAAFQLESTRLKRLEDMIGFCTLRAPRDGLVVYANQSDRMGRVESQIQEGVTVRQSQPIFYLPDPRHMRVKARVNESKTSLIHEGQKALIRVDAFPDRPMTGTVAEITAIPAPANVANLDVQVYFATVNLDSGGFDELRPGLSAEVEFLVDRHAKATRIPLEAVRWVGDQAFAAVTLTTPEGPSWRWTPLKLGLNDSRFAEVISGLKPGDNVVARPLALPAPSPRMARAAAADASKAPRG